MDKLLLQRERSTSDRLIRFFKSLVIKNAQESRLHESDNANRNYRLLEKCISKITTFSEHTFSKEDMLNFGVSKYLSDLYYNDRPGLDSLTGQYPVVLSFLRYLERSYIDNYVDGNTYVCKLAGVPVNNSEIVRIANRDDKRLASIYTNNLDAKNDFDPKTVPISTVSRSTMPKTYNYLYGTEYKIIEILPDIEMIPIHLVSYTSYPNTYTTLFVDRAIDILIANNHNLDYIGNIEKGLTTGNVRTAKHFEIIWCDTTILTPVELSYFYESYDQVKDYVFRRKYNTPLEQYYEQYSVIMLSFILFGTFQRMCNMYIDKFSIRDYTDMEIYDILDSVNKSDLKGLDIKILRRVVANLDELLSYESTEAALTKVLDIVSVDRNISVRRFDLVKTFKTDKFGDFILESGKSYDNTVGLAFVDRVIYSTGDVRSASRHVETVYDYDNFIQSDTSWGGVKRYATDEGKASALTNLKQGILKIPFNRIPTKYIGVSSVVNVVDVYERYYNKLGLLLQIGNGFTIDLGSEVEFKGMYLSPIELYSLSYYTSRLVDNLRDGVKDYDTIDARCWTIGHTFKLTTVQVSELANTLLDMTIMVPGNKYPIRVGNVLDKNDILPYLPYYGNGSSDSVIALFDDNLTKMKYLLSKANHSGDIDTVYCWRAIYNYFIVDVNISKNFIGFDSFERLFKSSKKDIYALLENNVLGNKTDLVVETFSIEVYEAFQSSMLSTIKETMFDSSISVKNGNDLGKLINSFASLYVELRSVDISLNLSDTPNNRMSVKSRFISTDIDTAQAKIKTRSFLKEYVEETICKETISFTHHVVDDDICIYRNYINTGYGLSESSYETHEGKIMTGNICIDEDISIIRDKITFDYKFR